MQMLGRAKEVALAGEIGGVDDQCEAVPPPARVSIPQANARRQMGTAIQRNDSSVVNHLSEQDDVAGSLLDLVVTVVAGPVPAQPGGAERDAPEIVRQAFRVSGRGMQSCLHG